MPSIKYVAIATNIISFSSLVDLENPCEFMMLF